MKTGRLVIASFASLTIGIYLLFAYCKGTAGASSDGSLAGTLLKLEMTATGLPAICGFLLTILGSLLLVISVTAVIVTEIRYAQSKATTRKQAALDHARETPAV